MPILHPRGRRRRHRLPGGLTTLRLGLAEWSISLPRTLPGRLGAAVDELRSRRDTERAQEIGNLLERRDEVVRPDAEIAVGIAPFGADDQGLGENGAKPAERILGEMVVMPFGRVAVLARVHLHGRQHHAVLELDAAAAPGPKEVEIGSLLIRHVRLVPAEIESARMIGPQVRRYRRSACAVLTLPLATSACTREGSRVPGSPQPPPPAVSMMTRSRSWSVVTILEGMASLRPSAR